MTTQPEPGGTDHSREMKGERLLIQHRCREAGNSHFRAFQKPKPEATKFIEHICFQLFMLCVYVAHFIVSTKKGDQTDNPNRARGRTSPRGRTIWIFTAPRRLYKPRSLPGFYVPPKESVSVQDKHLVLYVYFTRKDGPAIWKRWSQLRSTEIFKGILIKALVFNQRAPEDSCIFLHVLPNERANCMVKWFTLRQFSPFSLDTDSLGLALTSNSAPK